MKQISLNIACALLLAGAVVGRSATITWTNISGGNWTVAANWSPHQVPTNYDVVYITTPGTYAVEFDSPETDNFFTNAARLTLGAGGGAAGTQTFNLNANSLSVGAVLVTNGGVFQAVGNYVGYVYPVVTLAGGVLNATNGAIEGLFASNGAAINSSDSYYGPVTLEHSVFNSRYDTFGKVTVSSGGVLNGCHLSISDSAAFTIGSGGVVNMLAPSLSDNSGSILDGFITNYGVLNLTNTGILIGYGWYPTVEGGIVNQSGGAINFSGAVNIGTSVGYGETDETYFINRGRLTQDSDVTNGVTIGSFDTSQGAITNLAGTLVLSGFTTNLAGTFYAGPGAVIQLKGINDGVTVTTPGTPFIVGGSGSVQFTAGILEYNANTIPNLDLHGGSLMVGPAFQGGTVTNLTLDGATLANAITVTGHFNATNSWLSGEVAVGAGGSVVEIDDDNAGILSVGKGGAAALIGSGNLYAPVNVAAGGVLTLDGAWLLEAGLTNAGTVNLTNTLLSVDHGSYVRGTAGGIQNQSGGRFNFLGGENCVQNEWFTLDQYPVFGQYAEDAGNEYFYNYGTISQDIPGDTNTISLSCFQTAQGTVTNYGGTLQIFGTLQTNLAGVFDAAPGAIIQIAGGTAATPMKPGAPLVLAGGGTVQIADGYLLLTTNVIPNLDLAGGVLELGNHFEGGAITNLSLDGMALSNTLPVTGQLTVAEYAPLQGNFTVASGGVFTNNATLDGAVSVASGGRMMVTGGAEVNGSGGSLTLAGGSTLDIVGGGITLFGPLTNGGTIYISNLPADFMSGMFMNNDGSVTYCGGIVNQASGEINFASDNTMLTTYGSGSEYLINHGRIIKSAGSRTNYYGSSIDVALATNSGAITVQSGSLGMAPFAMLAGSSLNVDISSANNYGSIDSWTNVVLAGAFNATLNNGYVPANGATFSVVSYASERGTFSSLGLPSSVNWQTQYGRTNFTLVVGGGKLQFRSRQLRKTFLGTGS